ncbi:hypothetical protein ACSVDE_03330 [Pseudalkalibacillus sp. Hm43]|uniref:hypothetical protein n=1 Tax=Pseudalkalibacillus sp. Hm43 TaxID=3450742 RepID=UPI003F438350
MIHMKKYINWELVVLLLLLQWLIKPIGVDLSEYILERIFLGIFFFIQLIITWQKVILTRRIYWLMAGVFGLTGFMLALNLYMEGHDGVSSAFLGLLLPWFIEHKKKINEGTNEMNESV